MFDIHQSNIIARYCMSKTNNTKVFIVLQYLISLEVLKKKA